MKLSAPLLMGLALLWSGLALCLSHALPSWSGSSVGHAATSPEGQLIGSGAQQAGRLLLPEAKGLSEDGDQAIQKSAGVEAQTWRTAADEWGQGEFEGTVALGHARGLSLISGEAEGIYVSSPWRAAFAINALGAEWQGDYPQGAEVMVEVRLGPNGQEWSTWWEIPPSHDEEDPRQLWIGELIGVPVSGAGPLHYVQYRLRLRPSPGGDGPVVETLALTLLNSTVGPHMKAAKAALLPQEEDGGVPRPPVISRAGWGADESLMTWQPEYVRPKKVIIHHTVTYNPDPLATIRAIYYYHAVTRDWGDIGYNLLIDHEGNVYEGRKGGEGVVGGHARACNYGSIGIGLIGDFTQRPMSQPMEEALIEVLAWIADRYGIAPQGQAPAWGMVLPNILGHRDVQNTSCPGQQVYGGLPHLRAMAAQRLLAYPPAVTMQVPQLGAAVRGMLRVQASSSSSLLARLSLYIDDELVYANEASPLIWEWDTTEYGDGEHTLRVVARGSQELDGELARMVIVDNSLPHGHITINGGAARTRERIVSLTMTATDTGSGVEDMDLAEDGQWQGRERVQNQRDWQLSPGDGVRYVAVRFWDRAGNASLVYTDTIVLDSTAPVWDGACTKGSEGVYIGVRDELSGLVPSSAEWAVARGGEEGWGLWEPSTCSGSAGSTERQMVGVSSSVPLNSTIRFRVMDNAGNWSVSPCCILRHTSAQ